MQIDPIIALKELGNAVGILRAYIPPEILDTVPHLARRKLDRCLVNARETAEAVESGSRLVYANATPYLMTFDVAELICRMVEAAGPAPRPVDLTAEETVAALAPDTLKCWRAVAAAVVTYLSEATSGPIRFQ